MDNKKWYKRISTCFWFLLATLCFWLPVIQTILANFRHLDGITDISDISSYFSTLSFYSNFSSFAASMNNLIPSFFLNTFSSLIQDAFGLTYYAILSTCCAWFCWVYFIELMIDFVVWLPRLCHSFMERWCRD